MKTLAWLAFWQAATVIAVPALKRDDCSALVVLTSTVFVTVPAVTQSAFNTSAFNTSTRGPFATGSIQEQRKKAGLVADSAQSLGWNGTSTPSGSEGRGNLSVPTREFLVRTSAVVPSVAVITEAKESGTVQILPALNTQKPGTQGTVLTSLETVGRATKGPLLTEKIATPTSLIKPAAPKSSEAKSISPQAVSEDIFQPVATTAPPSSIKTRPDHPVPKLGIKPQKVPIGTNKFYANFFLGGQTAPSWTHPYSVAWVKGGGSSKSWGMSVAHLDANQRVFGPDPGANPVQYFINPIGIQSLILSAVELGASTELTTDSLSAFSINVNLAPNPGEAPAITFPLVQGMGFVTARYYGGTPILQSGIFFRSITKVSKSPKPGITKFNILLEDGKTWLLYASSTSGNNIDFAVVNNGLAQGTSNFQGIIQIAKNPDGNSEAIYDAACGAYPLTTALSGKANGTTGSYTFTYAKGGLANTTLLTFALPHHMASFSPSTRGAATNLSLITTTKGTATGIVADSWTLTEDLPTTMGFGPWSQQPGIPKGTYSDSTIQSIETVGEREVSQNMTAATNLDSMYFSGKALAKFAGVAYTLNDFLDNKPLAAAGLVNLKEAFAVFANNQQKFPLVYEESWGGIVSSASYVTGDAGVDFGNTYYNDHHFHYAYFILTAAIIGHLDPGWIPENSAYVNALVRDIANPSNLDPHFPVYRNFDWYHGHSWAHGLYESFDGKDQESTSEDSLSAYALKMWGKVTGDANLEARGNLQLAITARSIQNYFLYTSDNKNQPSNFIGNKASGILFENKIDHTTFFGTKTEFIQGIHMLPLLPSSSLTRTPAFVREEWDKYFSDGRADAAEGGWKGVLYANLALVEPKRAWNFFNQPNFDPSWIDGGASRTWYLAHAAGLGGAE